MQERVKRDNEDAWEKKMSQWSELVPEPFMVAITLFGQQVATSNSQVSVVHSNAPRNVRDRQCG